MRVLFLAPYPANESPSQRYRFEHYLAKMQEKGIGYRYSPFLSIRGWQVIFKKGKTFQKATAIIAGFLRRWWLMLSVGKYDFVYIHREAAPMGPPLFEWIIAKVWRKRIIYDYDDAIWIPVASENNRLARYVKWFSKVRSICKMAYKVSAGNAYLADYARPYCKQVVIIPTVVETERVHNKLQNQDTLKPDIGWTGTFSTLKYLEMLVPVINRLQTKYEFTFIIIANKNPELPVRNYRFIEWKKERESEDLLNFHIGIMPLFDGDIEKGKCGFKAIQYMALGIPAVVAPVGVNSVIVTDGKDGFTAKDEVEWEHRLEQLLTDPLLRKAFGEQSRRKVEAEYSVKATTPAFFNLFT